MLKPRPIILLPLLYGWCVSRAAAQVKPDSERDGPALFQSRCASCHTPFNAARAPWPSTLKLMTQAAILAALEGGKMRAMGDQMSHEQRVAVANYLGRPQTAQPADEAPAGENACGASSKPMANAPLWNGWGVDLANNRFQPANLAGLTKSQVAGLRVKWAFGYSGATSAGGPTTITVASLPGGARAKDVTSTSKRGSIRCWCHLNAPSAVIPAKAGIHFRSCWKHGVKQTGFPPSRE